MTSILVNADEIKDWNDASELWSHVYSFDGTQVYQVRPKDGNKSTELWLIGDVSDVVVYPADDWETMPEIAEPVAEVEIVAIEVEPVTVIADDKVRSFNTFNKYSRSNDRNRMLRQMAQNATWIKTS